jgi:predicted O-methyltransferase YrrM
MPGKGRGAGKMGYLRFLAEMHRRLDPRAYLEIGVRNGKSLALAACPSIGIDPEYDITVDLGPAVRLERTTSDDYFAGPEACASVDGHIDLAFIDGMHLFEYVLRDFINVERYSSWSSVIVFDDVLPFRPEIAARERRTSAWTGDVFRIVEVLRAYRPDLTLILVDTGATGLLLVTGLESESTVLGNTYDQIVEQHVRPDPQPVPHDILRRTDAVGPRAFLESGIPEKVRDRRDTGGGAGVMAEIARDLAALAR